MVERLIRWSAARREVILRPCFTSIFDMLVVMEGCEAAALMWVDAYRA
jgi:hypothetical protein